MRIVFKPAGTLLLLTMIAVLCFLAFNNVNGVFGPRRDAVAAVPAKTIEAAQFHAVDLTRIGKLDWAQYGTAPHPGASVAEAVQHKTGVTRRISALECIGQPPITYTEDPRAFRWQDGDGAAHETNARTGVVTNGVGSGFRFTVTPEVGKRHVLHVWVGGARVRSKLMVRLSDGSPLSQVDESYTSVGANEFRSMYTVVFAAHTPDQKLIATYLVADTGKEGSVSLQAAALE